MTLKDDTPAVFCTQGKAKEYADKMEARPDVRVATVAPSRSRGEMCGYKVVCRTITGFHFLLSNDMQERLSEGV